MGFQLPLVLSPRQYVALMLLTPVFALAGLALALQGYARLASRREWSGITDSAYASARRRLLVFLASYPVLWLLTSVYVAPLVRADLRAPGLFVATAAVMIWGLILGKHFRDLVREPKAP